MSNHLTNKPQRKTSIVELLSTPPLLGIEEGSDTSLSRHPLVSSLALESQQDWQSTPLVDLVQQNKLVFVKGDVSIEEAFTTLTLHNLTLVPVEEFEGDLNCTTFDYSDLNTYLLLVLHKIDVDLNTLQLDPHFALPKSPEELLDDIRLGKQAPVKFMCQLTSKNPFIKLNERLETLLLVCEILGLGVHRVAIVNNESRITGILSQRRLTRYLWENARRFGLLDPLWQSTLEELGIGSTGHVTLVYGDQPLIDALVTMHTEQMLLVAVVDRAQCLLGNISITDVRHVSKSLQLHLLHKSCMHFVLVILNLRGLEDGQDLFPIFHVFPNSLLGRVVGKLVATQSHRLWIVRPRPSGLFSLPSKPAFDDLIKPETAGRAGKLIGVVSLTDVLGLLARKGANKVIDPHAARKQRRRSSSSASLRSAHSLEQLRRRGP